MELRTLAAGVAAAIAVSACGTIIGGPTRAVGTLDQDGDGAISRAEAKTSSLEDQFSTLDKNRDGVLSAEEADAAGSDAWTGPNV